MTTFKAIINFLALQPPSSTLSDMFLSGQHIFYEETPLPYATVILATPGGYDELTYM